MKKILLITVPVLFALTGWSSPELKGAPEALRQFLHPQENVVSLRGKALEKTYSDRAVVNVVVNHRRKVTFRVNDQKTEISVMLFASV